MSFEKEKVTLLLFEYTKTFDYTADNQGYLNRFGDRAFCFYAPRLWRKLHNNIKAADSVHNF